jgi:hypothetical protein
MENGSLAEVKAAFDEWRSRKRHPREAIPTELLERARAEARQHGPTAVAQATKVDRARLATGARKRSRPKKALGEDRGYSCVNLAAPSGAGRPFAEVEMPTGVKVRLFAQTGESVSLLSSLLGFGGAR